MADDSQEEQLSNMQAILLGLKYNFLTMPWGFVGKFWDNLFVCLVVLKYATTFTFFARTRSAWNVAIKRIFLVKFKEVIKLGGS